MSSLGPNELQLLQLLMDQFLEDEQHDRIQWLTMLFYEEFALGRQHSRLPNIDRERSRGHDRLMRDYFCPNPVYNAAMFRRRLRMRRPLFDRVVEAVTTHNSYFTQRSDAMGLLGLSPQQKVTAAIRMIAYDRSADDMDEYLRIGETTSLFCLREFCKTIIQVFGPEYLRAPTPIDIEQILQHSAGRGFPDMLGSLGCMHWQWKNCPRAWAGQFAGRSGNCSIILEAVASYDLWVWHAFFGVPGSCNDLNVMDKSPLFADLLRGVAPRVTFTVNNHTHHMTYFLTDGIYPQWPVFMQTISNPMLEKRKLFAKMQEAYRKDIERCFGVLQARWAILKNPARLWSRTTLHSVITACIILHNMIVEDEQDMSMSPEFDDLSTVDVRRGVQRDFNLPRMIENRVNMRNQGAYFQLQNNLVEHLWSLKGQET